MNLKLITKLKMYELFLENVCELKKLISLKCLQILKNIHGFLQNVRQSKIANAFLQKYKFVKVL